MIKNNKKCVLLVFNITKIMTKMFVIFLIVGLVLNHFDLVIFIKAFEKPIETILEDPSILETTEFDRYELDTEKTRNSKTYKSANGLYETLIYNKAVHYLENGKYVNIDNTLEDIGNYYQNNKNAFFVSLPKTLKDNKIELDYQDYSLKIYYDDFNVDATLDDEINRNIENLHDTIYYQLDDNTTLRYDVLNESIKENIILNSFSPSFSYSLFIETQLLLESKDDKLYFYDNDELIFLFDNYLMYDKDYNISFDIQTNIKKISDTTYKIDVIPSNDYLENAHYPVTIDPEIRIVDGGILDGVVTLYEDDYLNNTSTYKSIGYFTINNRNNNLLNDDIVANFYIYIPRIYNTNISELITKNQLMYANMELTTISTNAYSDTSAILKYNGDTIDSANFHNNNIFNHKFNIIDAIDERIDNFIDSDLYFNLELSVSGANNTYINYSLGWDLGGDKPVITLGYLSEAGLSDYYTYEEFPMNNESSVYVAHNSGNLTYIYEDYSSDILLNLTHVYNTNRNNSIVTTDASIYGSGFDLNYHEYILESNNTLKLYKGSGKIIDFTSLGNNEYLSKDGTGDVITKIFNNNILTGYEMQVDKAIYLYDANGRLITIYLNEADRVNGMWNSDAKRIVITYTNNVITKIEDSYGNYFNLTYDESVNDNPTINQMGLDYLENVEVYKYSPNTNSAVKTINIYHEYESGQLVRIYKDYLDISSGVSSATHITNITYNARNQIDSISRNNKGYTFIYDNRNRVSKVKVYNGSLTNGDYLDFDYIPNGKETYVTNSDGEVIKYSFDSYYHTVKQENSNNYTTFYRYYDIYQDQTINYNLNHKIINQSNSFKNISNLVTNHGFEVITSTNSVYGWTKDISGTSSATIMTNNYLYGSHVLELYKGSGNARAYQNIIVEQGKEYIISCYIKNTNSGIGAYLDILGVDGVITPTSRTANIKETTDFSYYEYRFTSAFSGEARIYLVNESSGNAYFDNVNVSENYIDTRYNYLENSSFEKGITGWSGYDYYVDSNLYFDSNSGNKSLLLGTGYVTQTINKVGIPGDVYVFGGYAKFENYTGDVTVSLTFNNSNGDSDTYTYKYKNPVEASEYYMIKATALSDYYSITFRIENESISSFVWVDNFSLYNESYGINISYNSNGYITSSYNEIDDTNTAYTYDLDNNITSITTDNDDISYGYDTRGNLNQIESKNITTSFTIDSNDNITKIVTENSDPNGIKYYQGDPDYSSDGLYPVTQEDVLGNITTTTYDYLTGLVTNIIDSNSRFNSFTYDDFGNVKTFTEGKANNTKTVTYTYDTESNLTSITIGNTIYTFTYNSYNDLTSISINNEQIASYNYDNSGIYRSELLSETHVYGTIYFEYYDNRLVKSISHGNDKIKEFIYNDYNEVASIIDYKENIVYYYNYDYQNRLINVNRSDGNNITYTYDSTSRLVNKSNINGLSSYTYSDISNDNAFENEVLTKENLSSIYKINYGYTNDDYANIDVICFYINNNLIFEKEYDRETVQKDNIDYYTGRISTLEYTIGNDIIRYEYTYDDYNNITEINGYTNNVLTYYEENVYDIFNQLVAQVLIINGTRYLSEYGYDARGNVDGFYIMNCNTNAIIDSASFTYNNKNQITSSYIDGVNRTYTYQNNMLTSFNGFSVGYDFGKISSLTNNQTEILYYYNGDGLRTSKEIDGITTNYILEGNKIIRQTSGNNVINYYYDSQDDIIGFTYNNQKYLYLKNLQNDIIGILDNNGNIVVQYYYEAYGNLISIVDTSGIGLGNINPFRYRSYYYDSETGWYYLNSRFYDPVIKRFITPDDISYLGSSGSATSYNLYSYCENNPIVLADYNGNDAIYVCALALSEAFPVVGHAALLFQDSNNKWWLTQFSSSSWNKEEAIVKIDEIENYDVFIKKLSSIKYKTIYLPGNYSRIYEFAKKIAPKIYDHNYSFFKKNCLDYVHHALNYNFYGNKKLSYLPQNSIVPSLYNPYKIFYKQSKYIPSLAPMISVYSGGGGILYDCITPLEHILSMCKWR